ncbi:hypothetical protein BDB00DRAFT_878943 [Zychaea mexicana]|uniref:uncharacterized protein n=1 Tax=Zychaea mexicana TaxID=64656 RepID=UPI0022FE89E9|nr:uncharacterized protein BDB00DRAFT_878943 [Zychaea mexicana]KAI9484366.1 hypothetical protein BDB00DRAFT_878943 [Zychaea mexicana]
MISRQLCRRIPGRRTTTSVTTSATRLTTQTRLYSSSYRDNDRNSSGSSSSSSSSNSNNDNNGQSVPSQQQTKATAQERLSFMPVVNMPEAEFAHNAFFSLHRPLLGLSSDEERPFFTATSTARHRGPNQIQKMLGIEQPKDGDAEAALNAEDEAVTHYMMNLRPFEPPRLPQDTTGSEAIGQQNEDEEGETVVTLSFEDGHSAYDDIEAIHMDQSMPIFHMPDSDEVVDYLTAMQDKLQQRQHQLDTWKVQDYQQQQQQQEEEEDQVLQVEEENGRRRGANRPIVHAATAAEARKRTMSIQQHRQRTRRQRPIAMIDRKQYTK